MALLDEFPADVNPDVDPEASLGPGEEIVPASDIEGFPPPEDGYYPQESDAEIQQRIQNQLAGEGYYGTPYDDEGNLNPGWTLDENGNPVYVGTNTPDGELFIEPATIASAAESRAMAELARLQPAISTQRKTNNNGDWRVRLRLANEANYLYNAPDPGILQPLATTGGIIFPYTPSIDIQYRANYSNYDLTHSNYRGYFYQNSAVDAINIRCPFTAQSTYEANYLLAVIHFFRSVTKMFYGQDPQRGSPPPLVFLSGFGEYQFKDHPCLVQAFNYTLPPDVDYIRSGSVNLNNTNLVNRRSRVSTVPGTGLLGDLLGGAINRLFNAGLVKGAEPLPIPPQSFSPVQNPTYVPTKMEIAITLLPVQARFQVSQQFSLQSFANGDLLKGGFW